ncbi:helix-turn-helix domain-containing protein [Bombilactobacillus mellis]|uniref:helix-turn-helix domain-containing protein n=1 Tax=Bombilactobacillus mellis TaxID=1218508 RepID=UPI001580136A|nr:helix-turn-helix transcriptional regulator [Bombilactobacillus mellis]NUF26377.1 helix-turn-helix transcriptional regulator [Bombilactobacillus mellis]
MLRTAQEIAEIVKYQEELQNLSNAKLAKELNITNSALTRYFNGERKIPYDLLQKLADTLKVPVEYLILKNVSKTSDSYTELNYFDIEDNSNYSYKKANILYDEKASKKILIPNVTLGDYAGVKDICIFKMNASSLDHIMPNTVTVAVKQVKTEDLKDGDIVVFQNCHGIDIRLFFNDKRAKIISFVPRTTDKTKERYNYLYKDSWHFNIIGKVVLHTTQTRNPIDE